MKSSIELVPKNLLASHKRKLYAEDKITEEELELVKKIKDKVLENNISSSNKISSGCSFFTKCPIANKDNIPIKKCIDESPVLSEKEDSQLLSQIYQLRLWFQPGHWGFRPIQRLQIYQFVIHRNQATYSAMPAHMDGRCESLM